MAIAYTPSSAGAMMRATTIMTTTLLNRRRSALAPVHIAPRRARWPNEDSFASVSTDVGGGAVGKPVAESVVDKLIGFSPHPATLPDARDIALIRPGLRCPSASCHAGVPPDIPRVVQPSRHLPAKPVIA